ncbi:MAG: hypothetical protein QM690_05570 [Sphingobium sp.]
MKGGYCAVMASLALAAPAGAEVIDVTWGKAAPAREVGSLSGLAVGRFGGTDGAPLSAAVERRLAEARDEKGGAYYSLYALNSPGSARRIDAVVEGNAVAAIEERRFQQVRRYCKGKSEPRTDCDDKDKEDREVSCRRRVISLTSDLRVAAEADGRILYRRAVPRREEVSWCPGQSAPVDTDRRVAGLIEAVAGDYAADLSPAWQRGGVRLIEDRKGLTTDQGERFKAALRATKTDGAEACRLFDALAAETPPQRSLAFNAALCMEARGDLAGALAAFRAMGTDKDAGAAVTRIEGTLDAMAVEKTRRRG